MINQQILLEYSLIDNFFAKGNEIRMLKFIVTALFLGFFCTEGIILLFIHQITELVMIGYFNLANPA